ncbi:hypothetical protein BN1007_120107 [Klebsiella variicola]|nr:hypothetical protein BN1007_120107 [Klebsiella variicola]
MLPSERGFHLYLYERGMRIFCQKRASLSVLVCCFILYAVNLACFDPVKPRVIGVLRLATK